MGGPVPHERAAAMLHALRSLFVVTSGIAVAIVLFVGCEPVLPEDTSTDTGFVESYVGSYIAVGRSVEATLLTCARRLLPAPTAPRRPAR